MSVKFFGFASSDFCYINCLVCQSKYRFKIRLITSMHASFTKSCSASFYYVLFACCLLSCFIYSTTFPYLMTKFSHASIVKVSFIIEISIWLIPLRMLLMLCSQSIWACWRPDSQILFWLLLFLQARVCFVRVVD